MASRPLNGLGLCAGAGGLELGLRLALGDRYRMVGAVERDAYAAACLVARMEDKTLDQAPIWDDIATFDCAPWRGRVDLISAGFPCQPISSAGKRAGRDDERWLWPEVARVVRGVAPPVVFLENVPEIALLGLDDVLGSLAGIGFDAEWEMLAASVVGASHRRRRWFCLAYTNGVGLDLLRGLDLPDDRQSSRGNDAHGPCCAHVADANGGEPERAGTARQVGGTPSSEPGEGLQRQRSRDAARGSSTTLAYTNCERWESRVGDDDARQPNIARAESSGWPEPVRGERRLRVFPPPPDDQPGWYEWIAEDGPEPAVRRDADGLASRLDRLHTIGNGVVPLVAAAAFVRLARRARDGLT